MATPSPPPPFSTITAQQELLKKLYLFVSYMPYSHISRDKKVFNLANKI